MARRKSGGDGGGDSGTWMNTYADMVTLLLTFFAVLLSMSTVDQQKFEALIESFQTEATEETPYGGGGGNINTSNIAEGNITNLDQLYEYLTEYVEQYQQADAVSVSKGDDDIVYIRFNTDLFFRPNQYTLLTDSYPVLQFIGDGLKGCEDIIQMVNIAGHTADAQIETNVNDWRLSGDRAATVAIFLEDEVGFPANKIKIEGYGDQYPVADNSTEEGRRQNRRVELVVIGNEEKMSSPEAYQAIQNFYDTELYPTQGNADDLITPSSQVEQEPAQSQSAQAEENPPQSQSAQAEQAPAQSQSAQAEENPPQSQSAQTEENPPQSQSSQENAQE